MTGMMGLSAIVFWSDFGIAANSPTRQSATSISAVILDKDSKPFYLKSFHGVPVLINFWATWCPPCVAELSALDRAAEILVGNISVVLISVDRGGNIKALPFLEDRGIGRPHLAFDPKGALSREMGVRGLPTSFLLSADQSHSWAYIGPREWDHPAMIAELRHKIKD